MQKTLLTLSLIILAPMGFLRAGQQLESGLADIEKDIGTIGTQPAAEEKSRLRVVGSAGGSYTSNADNLGSHNDSDFLWLPAVEIGYNLPLGSGFNLDAFVRMDSVIYSGDFKRSFWAATGAVYVDHRFRKDLPRFYVGGESYYYQRFDSADFLTEAVGIRMGFDHGIAFNGDRTLFFFGYDYGQYWTRPSNDDRDTHRFTGGFMHQFTDKLFAQLFYTFQYSEFFRPSGDERRHVIGLNFLYQIDDHWSASLNTSYVTNGSSRPLFNYDAVNAGAQMTFSF